MDKKIITTLGPSSINEKTVKKLDDAGVDYFRINLSHVRGEDYKKIVKQIQKWTNTPICPDTEGAQLRTGQIKNSTGSIILKKYSLQLLNLRYIFS